jgi:hypothetical protein
MLLLPVRPPRVQAAVGGVLSSLVPRMKVVPAVRPEDLSQDPEVCLLFGRASVYVHAVLRGGSGVPGVRVVLDGICVVG